MVDLYPSEIRAKKYYFTNVIFYQNAVMVVKKSDDTIGSVKDLNHRKVAAQRGDFVNEFLNEQSPDALVINTDDYSEAVKLLKEGKVDAAVGDESVINHFLNFYDMKEDFEIHDELLYENTFVIGVPKSEPQLVAIKAVKKMIDYAFELGMNKVEIYCAKDNVRSRKIPERLGLIEEGTIRAAEIINGHYLDNVVYGVLRHEWLKD